MCPFTQIVLVDQPAFNLQHLTGLHGQLHQALIAGPELRHVLLQTPIPYLQDVCLTHVLVEAQAQFCEVVDLPEANKPVGINILLSAAEGEIVQVSFDLKFNLTEPTFKA